MGNIGHILLSKPASQHHELIRSLFDQLYDRLVFFAVQMIEDEDAAEDMVQESFVQLWKHIEEVQGNSIACKQYLYRSVKNQCLNFVRHAKVVEKYRSEAIKDKTSFIENAVVDSIIRAEVLSHVQLALDELPEHYRLISDLSYVEGKKNHEIADELGISINTLKKQKQKVLHLLRLKLTSLFSFLLFLFNAIN
ncbi:RNA polymerase sigma-70 factor [Sphingobacterium thermophilum]|uniref:RNA polymerase sigma-70 factor n=1 Tax=Sphingobacterium thermophilum TaxID=768534 RepID=UPI0031E633CE